jgi:hypothetical protein
VTMGAMIRALRLDQRNNCSNMGRS